MRFRGFSPGLLSGEEPEDEDTDREPRKCLGAGKCKQLGGGSCNWNSDALVDCPYMRGDNVDMTEWEID